MSHTCLHTEKSCQIKLTSDCIYHFAIDLEQQTDASVCCTDTVAEFRNSVADTDTVAEFRHSVADTDTVAESRHSVADTDTVAEFITHTD